MALAQARFLTCAECGTLSPPGKFRDDVRKLAEDAGWLTGIRTAKITGWEDDYCPSCRVRHERVYCMGTRAGQPCSHKAIVKLTRDKTVVVTCGSHRLVLENELLVAGGKDAEIRVSFLEG